MDISQYRPILYPASLAVVGASDRPDKFGGMYLKTILDFGYKGAIFPVNPKGGYIQGLKAYQFIEDIPGPVDQAVITVPAPYVPEALRACVKKGVAAAQVSSAGFRESGPEGEAREWEITELAKAAGVRIIGPNCFGVYSPEVALTHVVGAGYPKTPGRIGFVSQSGGVASDAVYSGSGRGLRFSVVVSCGNACDLDATEMLDYFSADPNTEIVGAYIEGVKDGRAFLAALRKCTAKKPVVILKGGLSDEGRRGTAGHTGSMAGSRTAWQAAIKSSGAVPANDTEDMVRCLMAFHCLPGFQGSGAAILAPSGARAVEGLDAASENGFTVPALEEADTRKLESLIPIAGGKAANPVDLAGPLIHPEYINPILEVLAGAGDVDFLMMYQMLLYFLRGVKTGMAGKEADDYVMALHRGIADKAGEIRTRRGKPLAMVLVAVASDPDEFSLEYDRAVARKLYTARGIPCFDTGREAFSVLRRVADYYSRRGSGTGSEEVIRPKD
ncbi:MAG: CoA-binding protein [Proteobacteria bacterium]|nr:CoA-binding protein [Pseudomonadota bacterium]